MRAVTKARRAKEGFFKPILGIAFILLLLRYIMVTGVWPASIGGEISEFFSGSDMVRYIFKGAGLADRRLEMPTLQNLLSYGMPAFMVSSAMAMPPEDTEVTEQGKDGDDSALNQNSKLNTPVFNMAEMPLFDYPEQIPDGLPDDKISSHQMSGEEELEEESKKELEEGGEETSEVTEEKSSGEDSKAENKASAPSNSKKLLEVTLAPTREGIESYNNISVNNTTGKYTLDIETLYKQKTSLKKTDGKKAQILIIHTHGTESYMPDERDYYVPTDVQRTEDVNFNVIRVGDELTKRLEEMGLNVIHDRTIYDYPSYNGSYGRSLASIQEYIKKNPTIQMVIDLHRDAIESADGTMYKTVTEEDGKKAAQMMFVIGTDASGLPHNDWKSNLSLAIKLQEKLLEKNANLMRPIHLRKERFNQHATKASMILEVGTAGNSLQEALLAINLFSDTVGSYLAENMLS